MARQAATVLIIDDDAAHRTMLSSTLRSRVASLLTAPSAEDGLKRLESAQPDLILLDMRMPGMGGLGFLRSLRESSCQIPVVVLTAFAAVEQAVEAMRLGAADYLEKPIDLALLEDLLRRYLPREPDPGGSPEVPPLPEAY
ncbi:MAG: response regulator, partial [Planctomycetota bacterium]